MSRVATATHDNCRSHQIPKIAQIYDPADLGLLILRQILAPQILPALQYILVHTLV